MVQTNPSFWKTMRVCGGFTVYLSMEWTRRPTNLFILKTAAWFVMVKSITSGNSLRSSDWRKSIKAALIAKSLFISIARLEFTKRCVDWMASSGLCYTIMKVGRPMSRGTRWVFVHSLSGYRATTVRLGANIQIWCAFPWIRTITQCAFLVSWSPFTRIAIQSSNFPQDVIWSITRRRARHFVPIMTMRIFHPAEALV